MLSTTQNENNFLDETLPSTTILTGPVCPSCFSLRSSVISDSSSQSLPCVVRQFLTQHSFVKISLSGILIGVSVQIFPFAVLNGFSRNDCFVDCFISANPEITRISNQIWDNFRLITQTICYMSVIFCVYNKNLEK